MPACPAESRLALGVGKRRSDFPQKLGCAPWAEQLQAAELTSDRASCSLNARPRLYAGVDGTADRIAHDAAGPGIQDHGQVDEAGRHGHISDVADPEMVKPGKSHVRARLGKTGSSWRSKRRGSPATAGTST
ncbi:hypothetical protein AZA_14798 [Nitrospirillum viridazoti Y2]|nr:hypothetical protein AZA_14798 [Nitrospirillum amazonense Y2]